jgi:hypothetical protein
MLIWFAPVWVESRAADEELLWFPKKIEPRYREILEKMVKVAGNSSAREMVRLGRGPFGLEYALEITAEDPEDMDFMQAIGAAPRMGVAIDILAFGSKRAELVGHVYEDGQKRVTLLRTTEPYQEGGQV